MSDQTTETEQDDDGIQLTVDFYPRVADDAEEDENGNVRHEAILREVGFGTGDPKILIEFAVNDRNQPVLAMTVGELNQEEVQEVLDLVSSGIRQALESTEK